MIQQTITLKSRDHFGRRIPAKAIAPVLDLLPDAVRQSVRMRFEGRSRGRGKRPAWLKDAADIRFLSHDGDDETVLRFELPTLGEAAPLLYEQQELWPSRPEPTDSGIDLLADVLEDVAAKKADSEFFDRPLLDSIVGFKKVLDGTFSEVDVTSPRRSTRPNVAVTADVVEAAKSLYTNTPLPQRVRILGRLDMLRASTRSFGLVLDSGEEIRGVLMEAHASEIANLMDQRVLILGKAIYRPSGRLLRVDAETVEKTDDTGSFFSAVPKPIRRTFDVRDVVHEQSQKMGVAAIIGKWPGDETDEEILEALKSLS